MPTLDGNYRTRVSMEYLKETILAIWIAHQSSYRPMKIKESVSSFQKKTV